MKSHALIIILSLIALLVGASAEQCGVQAGGALCPNHLCCSRWGWCGNTDAYCGEGCQSQCTQTPPSSSGADDISSIITAELFDEMLPHRSDRRCHTDGFYTRDAFIKATKAFPYFGTTGNIDTKKREIAAFLAQTSHESTVVLGGWRMVPGGPYTWGYCSIKEHTRFDYCEADDEYPCVRGRKYYGRGPFQLSYNYNYGAAGEALGLDLLSNPDLLEKDSVVSFESAIWYWMAPRGNKPSSHDVIIGDWSPSVEDMRAGRLPGYGVITNIINGEAECGHGRDRRVADRIGFYLRYCEMLGVDPGENLDCYYQRPFDGYYSHELKNNGNVSAV